MAALFSTKQRAKEKIGSFFERFKVEMRYINYEPQYVVIWFCEGLLSGTALYENLIRNPSKNMEDVIAKVEREIQIEKAKEALEVGITMDDALRET